MSDSGYSLTINDKYDAWEEVYKKFTKELLLT